MSYPYVPVVPPFKNIIGYQRNAQKLLGIGDIRADAWGIQKVSLPHSLFHGLFTFDVPPQQWFMYEGGVQVYTSTNIVSENGKGTLRATAAKPTLKLESRYTPRYQPNRGHLFSTALWCPLATSPGVRTWGLETIENGAYFELRSDGLYACLKTGTVETRCEKINLTGLGASFTLEAGNVYDIQYQWRGVGNYFFYINLILVHVFENLGTLTQLSMEDPALPVCYRVERDTVDLEMFIGCADITSENGSDDRLQYASAYAQKSTTGTNIPILVLYNPLQIHSTTNTRMIELSRISLQADKKSLFKVWVTRDPTAFTGATLVERGNGSHVQTDSPDATPGAVSATAVDINKLILITVVPVAANGSTAVDNPFQNRIDFPLVRGDYLVITNTASSVANEVVAEWGEAI